MAANADQEPDFTATRPRKGPPKASSFLAEELRAHILGNDLPVGARLPSERELIESFGLSRATVREAIRLLESEGLITVKRGPNGGISATRPNPAHISRTLATMLAFSQVPLAQLFGFRIVVEPPAAGAAAAADLSDEHAAALLAAADEHDQVAGTENRVNFHLLVAELSGNAFFHTILSTLHDVLMWHVDLERLTERDIEGTNQAHRRIARAIVGGDVRKAETTMRRHLERFAERMEEEGRLAAPIIPRSTWRRTGWASDRPGPR